MRRFLGLTLQLLNFGSAALAEYLQVLDDLLVLHVQEVLVEGIRGGHHRVKPDSAGFRLPEFRPVGLGEQWRGERMDSGTFDAPDQVDSGGDVSPLITAAELK